MEITLRSIIVVSLCIYVSTTVVADQQSKYFEVLVVAVHGSYISYKLVDWFDLAIFLNIYRPSN